MLLSNFKSCNQLQGLLACLRRLRAANEARELLAPLLRGADGVEGRVHDAFQRLRQLGSQSLDRARRGPCNGQARL